MGVLHYRVATFSRLHENGTIYRKESLINWSCQLQSTISDIEIDNKEIKQPTTLAIPGYKKNIEFGVMHTFDYPLLNQTNGESIGIARGKYWGGGMNVP